MSTVATLSVGTSESNGKPIPVARNADLEKENLQKSTSESSELMHQANGSTGDGKSEEKGENEIDIILNNVVCNFSVRCHLNLKQIAMTGNNVEFHREMAVMEQLLYIILNYCL